MSLFCDLSLLLCESGLTRSLLSRAAAARLLSNSFRINSNSFRSAFFFIIHQMALAASHASVRTLCTSCAVSNPRVLRLFNRLRSKGEEKAKADFCFIIETKSGRLGAMRAGMGGENVVGDVGGELVRVEDTDRRLVRTGVRVGYDDGGRMEELEPLEGGPLEADPRRSRAGEGIGSRMNWPSESSSSGTVAICAASTGDISKPSSAAVFLIVL